MYNYCGLKEFVGGKTCQPVRLQGNAKHSESKIIILFMSSYISLILKQRAAFPPEALSSQSRLFS